MTNLSPLRVLFFGMTGRFSRIALLALLDAGVDVCAVVVPANSGPPVAPLRPAPPAPIPLRLAERASTIIGVAWERGIPAFALRQLGSPAVQQFVATYAPDVACVACFPTRIPPALLATPRYGFLNVHPSLLPAYRGPSPLFWVLRDNRHAAGVTVHLMDAGFDTGPIVAQEPVDLPVGVSGADADALCAEVGGRLLVVALAGMAHGALQPRSQSAGGTSAPTPERADFRIDAAWPAERVFCFMRGTVEWDRPYPITIGETTLLLTQALRYDPAMCLDAPFQREGDVVAIQCTPGVVWARARSGHGVVHPLNE